MARPAEFDRTEVLDAALSVFWRCGYHATSVSALVSATGLKPGSLYGAFKSKRELFLEVIDLYADRQLHWVQHCLGATIPPLLAIHRFFVEFRTKLILEVDGRGGLMAKTLLELGPQDDDIRRHLCSRLSLMEQEFANALERAQLLGDLPATASPADQAAFIMSNVSGLCVLNSRKVQVDRYDSVIRQMLLALAPEYDWPALDTP
ncbi:TetR/AcrR family transcriptional regulator [Marinobacterium aestuariivivens]|uniref:TetR/AcrR family transcriptional regulator n=1 Tax=Marinobacterium aestuariivivens TaxID=1698799 RepID=A0ABW1ZVK8_9GAMM